MVPWTQPYFPNQGDLLKQGVENGLDVWTQPNGNGTTVFPQFPKLYPQVPQGYPQAPFAYQGFLLFGCGHWANTVEVFQMYDPFNDIRAALCCCPMCSFIQLIVEPAHDWWNTFYSLYNTGLVEHLMNT